MAITPLDTHPTHHRWRWVILILVGSLFLADQAYRGYVHRQVVNEIAAMRNEGYPVDLRELQEWHGPVADKENAAVEIMEAADYLSLPAKEYNPDHWPVRAEPLDEDLRETLTEILTNNAPALEAVHAGAHLPKSRFPIDYSRGPNTLLPHLAKVKSLTQLLKAKILVADQATNTAQAAEAIQDSLALARSLDTEPILISQLVRMACLSISCSSLERLLCQHTVPDAQLIQLADALRAAREASEAASRGGFVGEACFGNYMFMVRPGQMAQFTDDETPASRVIFPLYAWTGLRDRDRLFYLRTMRLMIDSAKLPFPERLKRAAQDTATTDRGLVEHKLLVFSRMLLPALQRATEKAADVEARMRCAETALAVELSRSQKQGTLPSDLNQLAELGNGARIDPMNGQSLHYKLLKPGYMIYSVGTDGVDDGGAERIRRSFNARRFPLSSKDDADSNASAGAPRVGNSSTYDLPFVVKR